MTKDTISQELWKSLYAVAGKIKKLAPWEYMSEDILFGVEHPKTKELGFVSVLGALSEHYAVTVYRGTATLHKLMNLYEDPEIHQPSFVLELPQAQVSFEDRDYLKDEDFQQIKKLGLKFRGKKAWPLFCTVRPCFMPWFLEPKDAELLLYALEQTLEVCSRFKENPELLPDWATKKFLVRTRTSDKNQPVWRDEIREFLPTEEEPPIVTLDFQQLHKLKKYKRNTSTLEFDYFLLPSFVHESPDEPPFMPYVFLAADHHSGMVIGFQMNNPNEYPLEELVTNVASRTMAFLQDTKFLPKTIYVRSSEVWIGLKPLTDALDIHLEKKTSLENFDMVRENLTNKSSFLDSLNDDDYDYDDDEADKF